MFSRTHSRLFAPRGFGSAQRATLTLFLARLFLSRIFWCSVISSHAWEGSQVPSNVVLSSIGFLVRVVQLKAPAPASFRVSNGNSGSTSLFFFFFLQRKYRLLCVKRYPSTSNAIQTSRLRRESREHWRRSQSCGRERRKIGTELRVARLHERTGGGEGNGGKRRKPARRGVRGETAGVTLVAGYVESAHWNGSRQSDVRRSLIEIPLRKCYVHVRASYATRSTHSHTNRRPSRGYARVPAPD